MTSVPKALPALIDLWARRHQLSPSQRMLLHAAAQDDGRPLHERFNVSAGELEVLNKLFAMRTGRSVHVALEELCRVANHRESLRPGAPK